MSDGAEVEGVGGAAGVDQRGRLREWLIGPLRPVVALGVAVLAMALVALLFTGKVSDCGERGRDGSNVRQVMQASVIFASDNGERLPVADDLWDYARQLAQGGALNDGTLWFSRLDPAYDQRVCDRVVTVLAADRAGLAPEFRAIKPAWAVTLGGLNWKMAPTTPVAWTRGLQADGTWAEHAPYGTAGGHVAFLGGEVKFFEKLTTADGLPRFDGRGMTTDIRKALPPWVKIGEYALTEAEKSAWSAENKRRKATEESEEWGWPTTGWFIGFLVLVLAALTAVALGVVLAWDAVKAAWRRRRQGGESDKE